MTRKIRPAPRVHKKRTRAPKLAPFSPADVVGVTFGEYRGKAVTLKPGTVVLLRAEPSNMYDPYAVFVTDEAGKRIGYLARQKDDELIPGNYFPNPQVFVARLLAAGIPVHGIVERYDGVANRLRVQLFVEKLAR